MARAAGLFLALFWMCACEAGAIGADEVATIDSALCTEMIAHHVMGRDPHVRCERLRLVNFTYIGFDHQLHSDGKVVVLDAVAEYVLKIFVELRKKGFVVAKAALMNVYDGDDNASMADNNTSAFNDRKTAGGSSVSLHALGLAIDLNPIQNPYLKRSGATVIVSPDAGVDYVNRLNDRPGKRPRVGMAEAVVDVFADNGFLFWGGYWDDPIDYQHFDVGRTLANKLIGLTPGEARDLFAKHVRRYLECRRTNPKRSRSACVSAQDLNGSPID